MASAYYRFSGDRDLAVKLIKKAKKYMPVKMAQEDKALYVKVLYNNAAAYMDDKNNTPVRDPGLL